MSTYGDLKISTINGGALSGFRNAIINGNFGINQRGVSGTVSLAAGVYGHDRWKAGASGCTYTFATSENVTTITISAGSLIQVVEGLNLQTGTYSLSWQGTAQGKIGAGSYGNSGITGSVTGGTNLNIEFGTGTLSLVQLEKGTVATPFEFRSIGQEEQLCYRYYYRTTQSGGVGIRFAISGQASNATNALVYVQFLVPMRIAPSALEQTGNAADYRISNGAVAWNLSAVPAYSASGTNTFAAISCTASTATSSGGQSISLSTAVTTPAYLGWSAEL